MFVPKLSLPRRTFLRGAGATLALPLLEAMTPAFASAAQAAPARRVGFVYVPHGAVMEQWTPATIGADFAFTPTLKPLEPFRDSLVVVTNLTRAGTTIGDHAVAAAGWLTSVYAKQTEAEDVRAGTTIDQVLAGHIGQATPFPSLELATEDFTGYLGGCTPGFSCTYMNTISWSSPTTPLPMEINPRVVFERLFGRPGSAAQRLARMRRNASILDSIAGEARRLQTTLGPRDRSRLGEYLDDVREIERRIQNTEAHHATEVDLDAPVGVPASFEEHCGLMFDLLAVAYQADLARVFTFMSSREASQRTYPQLDITEPWHTLSHHANVPEKIAKNAQINLYFAQLFARFVEKLQSMPDGDGSLLDHSLIFYGSGMSNSNAHSTDPLPLVAVGGGVGKGNRHIQTAPKTPVGNLWLDVATRFGVPMETFGNSNGVVDLL